MTAANDEAPGRWNAAGLLTITLAAPGGARQRDALRPEHNRMGVHDPIEIETELLALAGVIDALAD